MVLKIVSEIQNYITTYFWNTLFVDVLGSIITNTEWGSKIYVSAVTGQYLQQMGGQRHRGNQKCGMAVPGTWGPNVARRDVTYSGNGSLWPRLLPESASLRCIRDSHARSSPPSRPEFSIEDCFPFKADDQFKNNLIRDWQVTMPATVIDNIWNPCAMCAQRFPSSSWNHCHFKFVGSVYASRRCFTRLCSIRKL